MNRIILVHKLAALKRAVNDLAAFSEENDINRYIETDYPFKQSIGDLNVDVMKWTNDSIEHIQEHIDANKE